MNNFKYKTLFGTISKGIDLPDNAVIADLGCKDATFLLAFQKAFPNQYLWDMFLHHLMRMSNLQILM